MFDLLKNFVYSNCYTLKEYSENNVFLLTDCNKLVKEMWITDANINLHGSELEKIVEIARAQQSNILVFLSNEHILGKIKQDLVVELDAFREHVEKGKDLDKLPVPQVAQAVYSVGDKFIVVGGVSSFRDEIIRDLELVGFNKQLAEYISIEEASTMKIEKIIKEYTVRNVTPKVILEVGSFIGISTSILSYLAPKAKLIAVDPNFLVTPDADDFGIKQDYRCREYFDRIYNNKYKYLLNDNIKRYDCYFSSFPSDEIISFKGKYEDLKNIPIFDGVLLDEKIDIAFIDGEHTEIGVSSDLIKVAPKMKEDGIIVLHDMQGYWGKRVRGGIDLFLKHAKDYSLMVDSDYSEIGILHK